MVDITHPNVELDENGNVVRDEEGNVVNNTAMRFDAVPVSRIEEAKQEARKQAEEEEADGRAEKSSSR